MSSFEISQPPSLFQIELYISSLHVFDFFFTIKDCTIFQSLWNLWNLWDRGVDAELRNQDTVELPDVGLWKYKIM